MYKAWFFGDSFTSGHGATPGTAYYEWSNGGKIFSTLLAEEFNLEEINLGLPGKCNNAIIRKIVENLQYIKDGDLVVLSNTSPIRDLVPIKPDINLPSKHYDSLKHRLTSQKLYNSKEHPESIGYDDESVHKLLTNYALNIKAPFIPEWNSHFRFMFVNFVKYFQSIGCKSIFWDYSVWSEEEEEGIRFENIQQATNNEIFDLHWSYKGHRDAFEWIRDGLNQGKKFLK